MSRTIRRTRIRGRYPRFEADYLFEYPKTWNGVELRHSNKAAFPKIPLEGREFEKRYHKFHSDNGLSEFGFEDAYERPMKAPAYRQRHQARREICKWMVDPEYEIIIQRDPQIWDYC